MHNVLFCKILKIFNVYRTSNGEASWQQVFSQPNGFIDAIWMKTALQGFMVGDPVGNRWSLWKTSNGGITWDSTGMFLPRTVGTEAGWNNSLFVRNNKIWFGTNISRIYYSSNFGSGWSYGSTSWTNTYAIWFSWIDSLYGYVGSNNSYKTTNGGGLYTLLNCPGTGNFAGFCSGVMGVYNSSYPPTLSWTVRNDNKIYRNINMSDWSADYTAPSGNYWHIAPDYKNILTYTWAVRSNGGITRIKTALVGIEKISSEIPSAFNLYQNYPNPFNPVTKIKFSLPNPSKGGVYTVQLFIYDILGKEVAQLIPPLGGGQEGLKPGTYEVEWNPEKSGQAGLSSGVYFYKLIASDFVQSRKMILLK
jgi:hypothetical protein